jgi:hypothetical protein
MNLSHLLDLVCSKIDSLYSKIGNLYSKTEFARYTRFVFAGQASHPPLELPIKSGRAVKAATTVDFCQRVVSFVKKFEALFYSISREQIMKSGVGETTQEDV